jgi:hypothetical protein
MINPAELRLGNLIWLKMKLSNKIITVTKIEKEFIEWEQKEMPIFDHADQFKPIPLTGDWLHSLGGIFDECGAVYIQHPIQAHLRFYLCRDFIQLTYGCEAPISNYEHIKNVHELQNLFWVVTGKELILKKTH